MIQGFEGSYSHSQNGMTRADMEATALDRQSPGRGHHFPLDWPLG
jgi:hypothetical protein